MLRSVRGGALILTLWAVCALAQLHHDSTLFVIPLNEDSTSLYYLQSGGEIRRTLSGPIVMAEESLLLYSCFGYVLYNQAGAILDSHTVRSEPVRPRDGKLGPLSLACPIDPQTLLYYRETPGAGRALEILQKPLYKKRMRPLKDEQAGLLKGIAGSRLLNLLHNTITDEMAAKTCLQPQLVGFSALAAGERWWSADRFFGFSSPVLGEENSLYRGLFPGIRETESSPPEVRRQMVEPIGTFVRDGRRLWVGAYAVMGTSEERYNQTLYFCDMAGNILFTDTLLKQTNIDAVLGEDEAEKMLYTVKQTARLVFQPSLGPQGTVYYGVIDYENIRIEVHRISYALYVASPAEPDLAHLLDIERDIAYEPLGLACSPLVQGGKTIPKVTLSDAKSVRRKATAGDLTRDGYIVRVCRTNYRDLQAKLAHLRSPLPPAVRAMGDSLLKASAAGCPYTIALSGPGGMLRSLDYAPGETVLCSRVISGRKSGEVLVRVDLEEYAEIVVFKADGSFSNRFVFNRQNFRVRRDLIAASVTSDIIELDYEASAKKPRYLRWRLQLPGSSLPES
jgi:hypothetical protein